MIETGIFIYKGNKIYTKKGFKDAMYIIGVEDDIDMQYRLYIEDYELCLKEGVCYNYLDQSKNIEPGVFLDLAAYFMFYKT